MAWLRVSLLLLVVLTGVISQPSPLVLDLVQNEIYRPRALERRVVSTDTYDDTYLYYVDTSIGTPKQDVRLYVATNSADILLVSPQEPDCKTGACAFAGTFNINGSSTYKRKGNETFNLYFADNTSYSGQVGTDVFNIGGQTLDGMTILVSNQSTPSWKEFPTLGIGNINTTALKYDYANLPILLYQDGLSSIIGYSIYLNHSNASSQYDGRLAFGGIDTGKFYNKLETLPVTFQSSGFNYEWQTIQMSGIDFWDGNATIHVVSNIDETVMLEVGATGLEFPTNYFQALATLLGCIIETGQIICLQSDVKNETSINLQFGSTWIDIPLPDVQLFSNGTYVWLEIYESTEDPMLVGLPFFRNAYTVFDFSHNQISLAPLKHNATADNITAIDVNGVVGVVGVTDTPTTTTSSSSTSQPTSQPTSSSSSQSTSTADHSSELSKGAQIGIGVGVAVGGLAVLGLIGLLIFCCLRRRKKNKAQATPNAPLVETRNASNYSPAREWSASPYSPVLGTATSNKGRPYSREFNIDHGFYREGAASPAAELDSIRGVQASNGIRRKPVANEMSQVPIGDEHARWG